MNIKKSILSLTKVQIVIWVVSVLAIFASFLWARSEDYMTVAASLVGATALIFLAKGDALGQLLSIVFALLYAVISFKCRYYGEMITYLGMTLPSAAVAMINWIRNPYAECEVKVAEMTGRKWLLLITSSVLVTAVMGVVLWYFDTANLLFSTISVTTSYFASMLTIFRSPYYAVAYAFNDIVLIILWTLMTWGNLDYLPMVICFVVFLVNDLYGFANWQGMKKKQGSW
ncbi:MAG: nicotinamide mononucleotide transporter [Lachnospiraceae bacterium]|nr:nicotinamide mononucleotide transporter [Lachnospiraceae bacterium]